MAAPKLGNGATFSYTGLTGNFTSIEFDGFIREVIESSHLGTTTSKTFIPDDLYDAGTVSVSGQMDVSVAYGTPMTAAESSLVITWDTAVSITANAFATSFKYGSQNGQIQEFTATFKLTGDITVDSTP